MRMMQTPNDKSIGEYLEQAACPESFDIIVDISLDIPLARPAVLVKKLLFSVQIRGALNWLRFLEEWHDAKHRPAS